MKADGWGLWTLVERDESHRMDDWGSDPSAVLGDTVTAFEDKSKGSKVPNPTFPNPTHLP